MLRMVRRRKCSETGPKQCCFGPEQYQYPFQYNLYLECFKKINYVEIFAEKVY